MSAYQTSKKVRYTTAVIFIMFMTFIVGGSYLAEQNNLQQIALDSDGMTP